MTPRGRSPLTERSAFAIVVAKEGHRHDEEDAHRAVPALRADDCDGRECNRTDGGRADGAVGVRADRAGNERTAGSGSGVGCLPLVLWIEVVRDPSSVPGELQFRVRGYLLNRK